MLKNMKRINYLHQKLCTEDNINIADNNARKNKKNRYGINRHDKNRDIENKNLLETLRNLTYKTSKYDKFKIFEPKERIIYRLPYYPDRIGQHAIMNITEGIWVKTFINQTYSCIKNRGIHKCAKDIKRALRSNHNGTKYCLKLDIVKFYPSIDHQILKSILLKKIKDKKVLALLFEIIDSAEGVPIGNYLSQYFANLYLTYFDHYVKEILHVKYYFRYADDIVILHNSKIQLHKWFEDIKKYLDTKLKLHIKSNHQIFPVESRGIDFVGYKFYHNYTLLRKSIKRRLLRLIYLWEKGKISYSALKVKLSSYFGWCKYANCKNLLHKIEIKTGIKYSNWIGSYIGMKSIYNRCIKFVEIIECKKYFKIHFIFNRHPFYANSKSKSLFSLLLNVKPNTKLKILPNSLILF